MTARPADHPGLIEHPDRRLARREGDCDSTRGGHDSPRVSGVDLVRTIVVSRGRLLRSEQVRGLLECLGNRPTKTTLPWRSITAAAGMRADAVILERCADQPSASVGWSMANR